MINFIADVNLHKDIILFLRKKDYKVDWVYEINKRMSDIEILDLCFRENKVLLTNDKDFGELIFNKNLKSKGVILFRVDEERKDSLDLKIESLKEVLEFNSQKIYDHFIVISERKIRIHKL